MNLPCPSPSASPFPTLLRPFPEWSSRVIAFFATRVGGASEGKYSSLNLGFRCGDDPVRVDANWRMLKAQEGMEGKTLVMPRMVHGDVTVDADAFAGSLNRRGLKEAAMIRLEPDGADGVFSRDAGRILAVTMADCLTALAFDPVSGCIAAVHAGWRGTKAGILGKALARLFERGDMRAASTLVAFGPCLRPPSLEVGAEVAAGLDPAFVIQADGCYRFDMPGCNFAQALECGVPSGNIRDMGGDTLTEPERFFSYRRDGLNSGRMAAVICLR